MITLASCPHCGTGAMEEYVEERESRCVNCGYVSYHDNPEPFQLERAHHNGVAS